MMLLWFCSWAVSFRPLMSKAFPGRHQMVWRRRIVACVLHISTLFYSWIYVLSPFYYPVGFLQLQFWYVGGQYGSQHARYWTPGSRSVCYTPHGPAWSPHHCFIHTSILHRWVHVLPLFLSCFQPFSPGTFWDLGGCMDFRLRDTSSPYFARAFQHGESGALCA